MSYTVLARKYRPQSFDDLVGQAHVATTLSNAIASDRVAHAFLFTGVRGVGKTTMARLLAKALNCEHGPTATPCNKCDACTEITAGVDLDVLEMDGASNNSVDDVRRLQESIPYRPARDRLKIIIVDEVHMLSQGAFNAFLKTLEEPPPHVKFIFATTESHKVPITIRSRCQRYDFRLIPQSIISDRVRQILSAEGIKADDSAVAMVAREAAGSMRDALTVLDQIVAFGGEDLRGAEVARTLGIAGRESVFKTIACTLKGDAAGVLHAVDELASQGLDMLHFARQLLEFSRQLVILRVTGEDATGLVELVEEELAQAQGLAGEIEVLELQRAFSAISKLVDDVGRSGTPRTVLEMGLVRLATRPPLRQVSELVARLGELERRLGAGGGSPGAQGSRRGGGAPTGGARGGPPSSTRPENQGARTGAGDRSGATVAARPSSRGQSPLEEAQSESSASSPDGPSAVTPPVSAPPEDPARAAASPRQREVGPKSADLSTWEKLVAHVRDSRPALAAILEHGAPLAIRPEEIEVGFPEGSFFGKQARSPESLEGLAQAAAAVLGTEPKIHVRFTSQAAVAEGTMAEIQEKQRADMKEERRQEALNHPRVVEAMQVFPEGAANVQVRVDEQPKG